MRYVALLLPIVLVAVSWFVAQDSIPKDVAKAETIEESFLGSILSDHTQPEVPENQELYEVVRVIDGDTILVDIDGTEKTVRYIGIDTPETVHPEKPVQCFGLEASAKNKELVEGAIVRLERDISDTDKYGRLLRYVYIGDTFINYELVAGGFARSLTYPPDVAHNDVLRAAETAAREAGRGLWGEACRSAALPNESSGSCNIKGNISSSGNKLFHSPACPDYAAVEINQSAGERYFCSEDEAYAAGWRIAGNCY